MNVPLLPILVASITTFVGIYLLRNFAISIGLVDTPDNRKLHSRPVPLIGGIAMFVGIVISILTSPFDLNQFSYFLLASSILVMIGVLDDYREISISLRLLFQVLVAIIIVTAGGMSIESLGNLLGSREIILNEWAYFVTVIGIIAAMNAVNMADGIHGLAGGNSIITFLAMIYLSINSTSQERLLIAFLFCAVLIIFLINNLCLGMSEKKRIFMGDAGSMLIGLAVAWTLIDLTQGEGQSFAPVTALWLFGIPLIEMATAILRRLTSGKSPFKSDLYHSHHILIRSGFKEKHTLVLMLLISLLMAIIGILGEEYEIAERVMFFGFILFFGIYIFSYRMIFRKVQNNTK